LAYEPDAALTGAAFELANAGYSAMPDPKKKGEDDALGSDSTSLREAAAARSNPSDDIVVRGYIDDKGEPVAANETITLARAVRDYADVTALDKITLENESGKALAARVDAMRAEALARDPNAAEFYGFEPPQPEADRARPEKAAYLMGSELLSSDRARTKPLKTKNVTTAPTPFESATSVR
jgi:hypothetical protein